MATINQDPTGISGAGKVSARGGPSPEAQKDYRDTMALMRDRLRQAIGAYSESREDELDDLRFMAGSPDNQWQWPQDVLATRGSVQGQTVNPPSSFSTICQAPWTAASNSSNLPFSAR